MSKYINADLLVEMQIYDDEHEEWGEWQGTIEDLLDQWTEQGCPTSIEVSEDCISREWLLRALNGYGKDWQEDCEIADVIRNAPSVVPSRAEGEWKITNTYKDHNGRVVDRVEHTDCGHIWHREMGEPLHNYCPNCGAKMKG